AADFVDLAPQGDTALVAGAGAGWDHGISDTLEARYDPVAFSLLRFDLRGITRNVRAATLTLHCLKAAPDGGTLYRIEDSSWIEGDRTGVDAGSAGGPGLTLLQVDTNADQLLDAHDISPFVPDFRQWLGSIGPVAVGGTYSVDVTPAFGGEIGLYTLGLGSSALDDVRYASRDNAVAALRPRLRLELDPA